MVSALVTLLNTIIISKINQHDKASHYHPHGQDGLPPLHGGWGVIGRDHNYRSSKYQLQSSWIVLQLR